MQNLEIKHSFSSLGVLGIVANFLLIVVISFRRSFKRFHSFTHSRFPTFTLSPSHTFTLSYFYTFTLSLFRSSHIQSFTLHTFILSSSCQSLNICKAQFHHLINCPEHLEILYKNHQLYLLQARTLRKQSKTSFLSLSKANDSLNPFIGLGTTI